MSEELQAPQPQQRRPSIATIFNPRKQKSGGGTSGPAPYLGQRPSVVVTDEDTPYPIQLTNGGEGFRGYMSPRGSFCGGGRSGSFNLSSFSPHHDGDGGKSVIFCPPWGSSFNWLRPWSAEPRIVVVKMP